MRYTYGKREGMGHIALMFARTYDKLRKRAYRASTIHGDHVGAKAYMSGATDSLRVLAEELENSNLVDDLL